MIWGVYFHKNEQIKIKYVNFDIFMNSEIQIILDFLKLHDLLIKVNFDQNNWLIFLLCQKWLFETTTKPSIQIYSDHFFVGLTKRYNIYFLYTAYITTQIKTLCWPVGWFSSVICLRGYTGEPTDRPTQCLVFGCNVGGA